MFASIAGLIGAAATMAAGIGKTIKRNQESDLERAEPREFDVSDALGIVGEASSGFASMSSRRGLRPNKMRF